MSWICPACGHGNIEEWNICINCGASNYIGELQKEWEKKR
jgi:hypothetical protein